MKPDDTGKVYHNEKDVTTEQTYINMPFCDDCGVLLDSMHDLQRYVKSWCPENETLKKNAIIRMIMKTVLKNEVGRMRK